MSHAIRQAGLTRFALAVAALAAWLAGGPVARAAEPPAWTGEVAAYLRTLARDDGGYAWPGDADGHLTPAFAAVGTYRALGLQPPRADAVAAFVRSGHPQRTKKPEWELHEFDLQQVQALTWLGADVPAALRERVAGWVEPRAYLAQYERHKYPAVESEVAGLLCRRLLGMPADERGGYAAFLAARRRADGSYNTAPAADDPAAPGNLLNTAWCVRAAAELGKPTAGGAETAKWLRACQASAGGHFAHRSGLTGEAAAADADVVYTWAAVRALAALGEKPADPAACAAFVRSLYTAGGGFADRAGWPANPLATYYAIDTLATLGALDVRPPSQQSPLPATRPSDVAAAAGPADPPSSAYSVQIEAPGAGSPADAVELARGLRIHLWGAKNAKPGWIAAAQRVADRRGVPVRFFAANEEYGTFFDVPGMGTYSHLSDPIAPADADVGPGVAGAKPVPTWAAFRDRRIAAVEKAGGRMVYQFNENESLARLLLDEAVARQLSRAAGTEGGAGGQTAGGRPAYAAVSSFHFGQRDFFRTYPYLWHYQHVLPPIALQDNHAAEPWFWADQLEGFRTLFLADGEPAAGAPTWDAWLAALRDNRVAAVRHDAMSDGKTWAHGRVRDEVLARSAAWRWWPEAGDPDGRPPAARPDVSLAALTPADEWEAGRPAAGVALRVRRRWQSTPQGQPKAPAAELVSLTVDGKPAEPTTVRVPAKAKNAPAGIADEYYLLALPGLVPGRHSATATVRVTAEGMPGTGRAASQTIEFDVAGD